MSNPRLIELLHDWQPKRVMVVGDFMLDRYAYGNADRLSPDAPVPVLSVEREEHRAGGAGNVCLDLVALEVQAVAMGVIGGDGEGSILKHALHQAGVEVDAMVVDGDRPTTVKHNLVGLAQHRHPQKMFRMDVERRAPIGEQVREELMKRAEQSMPKLDAIILEDYGKGVLASGLCQDLIALARDHDLPVYVDPASHADYAKYAGATGITPNRTEAGLATGLDLTRDEPADAALKLRDRLGLRWVVVTLDKSGALMVDRECEPTVIPTVAREVYDVTGAGDMVVAVIAAAMANGAELRDAVELANIAAGLEVEKAGVVPIPRDELMLAVLEQHHRNSGKRRDAEALAAELPAHRAAGRKVVFTNGCFDILHAGHVRMLREARAHGDLLVVGVNADESVKKLKGPERPVNPLDDRVAVLAELQSVDFVVPFEDDTPERLLQQLRPEVLVKGGDYSVDQVVGKDLVEAYGGRVAVVSNVQGKSTTAIIDKMRSPVAP